MSGWKDWQIGEVVTEGDFQSFMQDQVVQRYADSTARDSTLGTAVAEGMVAYLDDTNAVQVYDGTSWIPVGEGDITAVNAGTALTGGGTEGDVTLDVDLSAITIPASQVSDLTATAAALNTIDDGTQGFTALSNGTAGISYQPVSHNYIINGAFDVWQRGTSFSAVANNAYTADRWNFTRSGTGNTISQQTFSAGELEAASFGGSNFYLRLDTDGTDTAPRIGPIIEDVRTLAGQTATLSFWAKSDVSDVLQTTSFLLQEFGSGGSAQVATSFTLPAVTTSWQRYSVSINIPSVSGKTIGPNSRLYPQLRPKASTEFTLDIWGVQLEAGSVATPFKRHAPSLQGELAACQRYYQRRLIINTHPVAIAAAFNTTVLIGDLQYAEMRAAPSFTASGTYASLPGAASVTLSGFQASNLRARFDATGSGYTAALAYQIRSTSNDSFIELSAEL